MGFLDQIILLSLFFKDTFTLISIMVLPIYIPTKLVEGFLFPNTLSEFIVCRFFDDGLSDWCEVIPHGSFDFHLSNN